MLALLVSATVAAGPAMPAPSFAPALVLSAKKKKKAKSADTKEKDKPAETSEGLDLSKPEAKPAPAADPAPAAETSVAEDAAPKKEEPSGWSLVTPRTVGESQNVLEAGVGWPGVYAGYWRGILGALDVGAKVGFNWSYEGVLTRIVPGMRIQAQARYLLWDNGSLSLGLGFAPGALIYFYPGSGVQGGMLLPLSATVGLPHFVNKLNLSATLEVSFFMLFAVSWALPVTVGANGEYFITDSLVVFAKVKPLGFALFPGALGGLSVFYTFEATAGVGYHL
jgi:hypothetical protein